MPTSRDLQFGARMQIPPALAVEVPRDAVVQALFDARGRPLTVVTGGPGWGKTTSVAAWAREAAEDGTEAVVWLDLVPADNSAPAFWGSVLMALRSSGAVPDDHPLALMSVAGGVNEEVLRALLHGLDTLPTPIRVVLDDFHVIDDADVMAALADLVGRQANVRLTILTRFDPPLPLHRLRLEGALAEISAADLAFDADAARLLASGAESLELSDGDVGQVIARTEGWPAGVRLATMYLARNEGARSLDGFGGSDRSVADYLVAEVLHRNEPDVRDFLLRTSVAQWINGDLADAIVPGGQGHARLEELERSNQFVVSVNPERTIYRYHPLLRDLLLHLLRQEGTEDFRSAHRSAAGWLLTHGNPIRAMEHAVAAEDWELATDAFAEASPAVVGSGRSALAEVLRKIPFTSLEPTAALELCAAGLEFATGHLQAVEGRIVEARRLLATGDRLSPVGMAFMENLACVAARVSGDEGLIATTSSAALAYASHASPSPGAQGNRLIATTQSAVGLLRSGDTAGARARLVTITRGSPDVDLALIQLASHAHLSWCSLAEADIDAAITRSHRVIADAERRGWASLLPFAFLPLAAALSLRGDDEAADRNIARGLATDEAGREVWPTVALHIVQASVAVSRHRPRAAAAALAAVDSAMNGHSVSVALAGALTRVQADVAIMSGSVNLQTWDPREVGLTATQWSTRARLALAVGQFEAAMNAVSHVQGVSGSDSLDDLLAAIESALIRALVTSAEGNGALAGTAMGEALSLASGQLIVRPFTVIRPQSVAGLVAATPPTQENATVRELILEALAQRSAGPTDDLPEPEPLADPLTERELAVLLELPTMGTNEEIAKEFYVSVNTVKSHLKHTYRKLGVTNRRDAVRRARELGLLP